MKQLTDTFYIRNHQIKNRIGAAPMGNASQTDDNGKVSPKTIDHYRKVARSGTAWITLGHVAVSEKYPAKTFVPGQTTQTQICSDEYVDGLLKLTEAVHSEGAKIVCQIEHGGMRSAVKNPPAPSAHPVPFTDGKELCHPLTLQEIIEEERSFWEAGRRVYEAGFDGVEISASNGWMLHNWTNRLINLRDDEYGKNRLLIVREVFQGIRKQVPDSFIIGVRMAGNNPDLKDGLEQAIEMEKIGFDYISLCNNPMLTWMPQNIDLPKDYKYAMQFYSAQEIKKVVNVPVLCANSIRTTEDATSALQETDVDMILIGRGMLCDPDWTGKALKGEKQITCLHCLPHCKWKYGERCAAILASRGDKTIN